MGKKVVLDTNVLIAALGWDGKPRRLFHLVLEEKLDLVICEQQIDELIRVMNYSKFDFPDEEKRRFLEVICNVATFVQPTGQLKLVKNDPTDDVILESSLMSESVLITGDSDLLDIDDEIVTPADFLEDLELIGDKGLMRSYHKARCQVKNRDFEDV